MDLCQVIGANVRRYRLARRMTQVELAKLSGVNRSNLNRLESGAFGYHTTIMTVERLAKALEIEPSKLLAPVPKVLPKSHNRQESGTT
jgi:transcriptional regulator with XRE-family HTH domain